MFATRPAQPAASPVHVQTRPQYFLLHSSLLTPLLTACSVARLACAGPGLRQLQPAASCGRRLLAKTCLGWQPKDGPTSSTASAGGAQISEAKGSNKYLDNIYKMNHSKIIVSIKVFAILLQGPTRQAFLSCLELKFQSSN